MQRSSIPFFRISGVPVRIHAGWLLVLALATWALAGHYLPVRYPDWTVARLWSVSIVISLLCFCSALLHELVHFGIEWSAGDDIHDVVLYPFGGAPDLGEEPPEPNVARRELRNALGLNVALTLMFGFAWVVARNFTPALAIVTAYVADFNALLVAVNLIPGFPLDGGRLLRSLVYARTGDAQRAAQWATGIGQVVAYVAMAAGLLVLLQFGWTAGIWVALAGWFVETAAQTNYRQSTVKQFLQSHQVSDVPVGEYHQLELNMTLEALMRDYVMPLGPHLFPVASDGQVQGVISLALVRKVPPESWPQVTVRAVTNSLDRVQTLGVADNLWEAMRKMSDSGQDELPIVADGRFHGILADADILRFLQGKNRVEV